MIFFPKFSKLPLKWQLVSIFTLAFIIRLAMNIVFQGIARAPNAAMGTDHIDYDLMAQNLASGQGLSLLTLSRPPGVAFLLFPIYCFFGVNYVLARLFFCLLGAATCVVVFFIGKRLSSDKLGILASIILCLYPMHFYYSMHFLSEIPWAFFMSLAVLCLLVFEEKNKMIYAILAGFFIGFSAYLRPIALFYLPFYIFLSFVSYFFRNKIKFFKIAVVPLIFMVLAVTPWIIRNYKLTGHFILISSQAGRTFWAANNEVVLNNPKLIGSLIDLINLPQINEFIKYKTFYEQDEAGYRYGINFIKHHLKDMPKLELMKLYRLFTPFYNTANKSFNLIGGLSWAICSIFVFWGLAITFRNTKFNALHAAFLLMIFIALIFYGDHRFRESISPFLVVYAAAGWLAFKTRINADRKKCE